MPGRPKKNKNVQKPVMKTPEVIVPSVTMISSVSTNMAIAQDPQTVLVPIMTIGQVHPFSRDYQENVEEWINQFEWITTINVWLNVMKEAQLPTYLVSTAKSWYILLPSATQRNYAALKENLLKGFS